MGVIESQTGRALPVLWAEPERGDAWKEATPCAQFSSHFSLHITVASYHLTNLLSTAVQTVVRFVFLHLYIRYLTRCYLSLYQYASDRKCSSVFVGAGACV